MPPRPSNSPWLELGEWYCHEHVRNCQCSRDTLIYPQCADSQSKFVQPFKWTNCNRQLSIQNQGVINIDRYCQYMVCKLKFIFCYLTTPWRYVEAWRESSMHSKARQYMKLTNTPPVLHCWAGRFHTKRSTELRSQYSRTPTPLMRDLSAKLFQYEFRWVRAPSHRRKP